jgi:DNA-binding response OmpR family regulator
MSHKQALVVDDEQIVALDLERCLEGLGYGVAIETTGTGAVETVGRLKPDIVFMDIRLEGPLDGIQAAEQIREKFSGPLIFLTAYADHQTIERAAQVDPSGYIVKPFNERDLAVTTHLAIYKARNLRRTFAIDAPPADERRRAPSVVHIGGLKIDFIQRSVFRRGTEILLTKKEFDILQCLAEHLGAPVSPEVILTGVWGAQFVHYVQTLRVHVGNLRKKIEADSSGIRIEGIRGVGYRLILGDSDANEVPAAIIEEHLGMDAGR